MSTKTYYATRWALTRGILRLTAEQVRIEDGYLRGLHGGRAALWFFVSKKDWFETEGEALARVEDMKKRQRATLNKALKKLGDDVAISDWDGT